MVDVDPDFLPCPVVVRDLRVVENPIEIIFQQKLQNVIQIRCSLGVYQFLDQFAILMLFSQELIDNVLVEIFIVGLKQTILFVNEFPYLFVIFRVDVLIPFLQLETVFLTRQTVLQKTDHLEQFLDQDKGYNITDGKSELNCLLCH